MAAGAESRARDELRKDVRAAISDGASNVQAGIHDGTATLFGYTDTLSELAANRVAAAELGVTRVLNLIEQRG